MMDEAGLQTITQQWLTITDPVEGNKFYDEKVFPALQQVVVPREQQKHPTPYPYLILPVGLSPEPLILSIRILQPDKVYLLYTRESEKFLDRIVQETGLRISQVDKDEIDDTNVPDIYQKVKAIYSKWGHPQRIAVDISGGKKSMIGGCALAGNLIGAHLFYMDSRFIQKLRKPEPGSEHLAILENPYDVFGDLEFKRAEGLFSKLDFAGASALLANLQHKTSTPELYEGRALLCQAYSAWDDWDIKIANEKLTQAIETVNKHFRLRPNTPLSGQLPRLEVQRNVLGRLNQALQLDLTSHEQEMQLLGNPNLYQPMIGNLRSGAIRYERRGKMDVAALLWYRLIEFLSQRRLSIYGLVTSDPNYGNTGREPEELLKSFQKASKDLYSKKQKKAVIDDQLPAAISLLDGYTFLKALDDPFTKDLHLGKIRGSIDARNHGIFAHGFKPLSCDGYQSFKNLAEELIANFTKVDTQNIADWEACQFIEAL